MNSLMLKSKRILANINQHDMAKNLGISNVTYSYKENGKYEFTRSEISKISEILNLDINEVNKIFFDNKITECIKKEG